MLGSGVVRKFVESPLSPSSCATEQVLANNKLSRSVLKVFVFNLFAEFSRRVFEVLFFRKEALQKANRIFLFAFFLLDKTANLNKKSVPTGLVLTVPSFKHLLVLRIPLRGTPSTTGG